MRNLSQAKTEAMLIQGKDYLEFKQAIAELWQAQAMAEIIATTDVEHIDAVVLQTAVRGIMQFIEKSVMTIEEIGVMTQAQTTTENGG